MVFFDDAVNRALQDLFAPTMDPVFIAISDAGDVLLYGVIIAALYWCYDKRFAIRLAMALLLTVLANKLLKLAFQSRRPPKPIPRVEETGFGFPSGHAQNAATFWGYLSSGLRNRRVLGLGIVAVAAVGLSRLYLGVHYLGDVLGGVAFGVIVVLVLMVVEPRLIPWLKGLSEGRKYAVAVIPAGVAFILHLGLHPSTAADFAQVYAPAIAFSSGYLLEEKYIGIGPAESRRVLALRLGLGLPVLAVVAVGLSYALPDDAIATFVRLLVTGYVVTLAVPWLLNQLGGRRAATENEE